MQVGVSTASSYWIGGTTLYMPNQWLWSDGSNSTYVNWAAGQPSSTSGCITPHIPNGLWYSESCETLKYYICEIQPSSSATTYPTRPPYSSACPPGWLYMEFPGKCYYFENKNTLYFNSSRARCQNLGGDLVTIHSFEENTIVAGLIMQLTKYVDFEAYNDIYIGLYKQPNNTWAWIDGSPVNFTYWGNLQNDQWGPNGTVTFLQFGIGQNFTWVPDEDSGDTYVFCEMTPQISQTNGVAYGHYENNIKEKDGFYGAGRKNRH
uniref:C-type lectin domain-containing protein n=1 Tax=Acrobeloides nanus TaxID=290746 RepID=A0A914CGQ7_9BILA